MELTETQRTLFRQAVDCWNGDAGGELEIPLIDKNEDVVETHETVENFRTARGVKGKEYRTLYGTLYIWAGVQARPGLRRGTEWLMDFGTVRAVYFDGELPEDQL